MLGDLHGQDVDQLQHARGAAAGLLPVTQPRVGNEPLAADPAGALSGWRRLFHRFLHLMRWEHNGTIGGRL